MKNNITYDFTFAELACRYLSTGDTDTLQQISNLDAIRHILSHAKTYNYNVPTGSGLELATFLLSPFEEQREKLHSFKRNIEFVRANIVKNDVVEKICMEYLPQNFHSSATIFFTFGYDLGVAYGKNCSLNLAHPYFINNINELKYYAIHELHHACFITLKGLEMPSLDIKTYGEMARQIELSTHLEGMGTFAPLKTRIDENAMAIDSDYISLGNSALMEKLEAEYFKIYFHFKNNPEKLLAKDDLDMRSIMSNKKRLWYIVGAHMAKEIDSCYGREALVNLIPEPSEKFIKSYLKLKYNRNML